MLCKIHRYGPQCDEFDESEAETYMEEFYYNYYPMLLDSLGDNGLTVYFEVAGEVDYESAFYRVDNYWGGPDATLYAYRESGLESVDSYYFN